MHRLVPVIVAFLTLGSISPTATGQGTPPVGSPAAATCLARQLASGTPSTEQRTPGAEETAPATADAPGSEAPLPQRTPPPGTPAGTALLERIRIAEENLARCFVAGDSLGFIALLTPKALLTELGLSDPQATPAHSASFLIVREHLLSVTDAQTHADGRVSADIVIVFEGQRMRARDIFVETDGSLLLDEVIALPLEPAPAATPVPVDAAMFEALTIVGFPPEEEPSIVMTLGTGIPMQPGDATKLVLGVFDYEVCGTGFRCFVPAAINATWSVTPTDGARVDPTTGVLTIDPGTPSSRVFTARAAVEGGRHVVETQITIFTPEANPLIGIWREEAQLACDDGTEAVPAKAIVELIFLADGTFGVTWVPFESYQDYWGTYTFDLAQGTLELTITGGNSIPPDVDGEGHFAVEATGLILSDVWLGTPSMESGPVHCGHRFVG